MGMFDIEYTFDNLIRTTASGVEMSSFVQMKDAIIKRYKEIYGNDIDVDSTTGDGQFLMMLALMLFNGYSGIFYLNQNLDPAGATGPFLDRLCSFNNVLRKFAEPSNAYLYVKYIGRNEKYNPVSNEDQKIQEITCIDKAGKLWKWSEGKGVSGFATTFSKNDTEPKLLKFICEETGPITAEADENILVNNEPNLTDDTRGFISQVLDKSIYPFEVWQAKDATVGTDDETDTALRQRRLYELGNTGVTVLNGLRGSLVRIEGVEEVKVYNNVVQRTSNSYITQDGSDVEFHDIYICLRYKKGVDVDRSLIGQTIYNKMTPGIVTVPLNYEFSGNQYKTYAQGKGKEGTTNWNKFGIAQKYDVNIYQGILRDVISWKECTGINPALKLEFLYHNKLYSKGVNGENSVHEKLIIDTLKKATFNLTIFDDLNVPNLMSSINASSPVTNGQTTFIFINGLVKARITQTATSQRSRYDYDTTKIVSTTGTSTYFENCDTFYDYSDSTFKFEYNEPSGSSDYASAVLHVYKATN